MKKFRKFILILFIPYLSLESLNILYKLFNNKKLINLDYFFYFLCFLIIFYISLNLLVFYRKWSDKKFGEELDECMECGKEVKFKNLYFACRIPDKYLTLNDYFNIFPHCSKECCIKFYESGGWEDAARRYEAYTELPSDYYDKANTE